MKADETDKKDCRESLDVMTLLAKEAEDIISVAGKSALQEAREEIDKILLQYEQKAKQIILKIREETRTKADDVAIRFRDALMLRVEEASTAALSETITDANTKTEEIIKRLQEAIKKEARQALAEGLLAGDNGNRSTAKARQEESKPESKPGVAANADEISLVSADDDLGAKPATEDFEDWLRQ